MNKYLLLVALALVTLSADAQTDTLFWFAAPELTNAGVPLDRPILLRITSYSNSAVVTISEPASPSFTVKTINVPANSLVTFDLTTWIDSIENKPANAILNHGLKIQSTNPVTIYYEENSSLNPDIFVLKGQCALGTDFWIPSQNLLNNSLSYTPITNSSFDIIASENNTSVRITPSNSIIGNVAGTPFTITLNEGQSYSAMASSNLAAMHLQGSRVTSDKPVAITIKDDVMDGGSYYGQYCLDMGGDQIVPTPLLGTEYIAINGYLYVPGDKIFILATQDTTIISQNGIVVDTIDSGQTKMLDVGDSATYIKTTHPVYISQLSGISCETGINILPQIIGTGSTHIALARSTTEPFYINLLVPNGGQNNFLVNGGSGIVNGSSFKQVPGTSGNWLSGQISLSTTQLPVGASVIVSNTSKLFHLSVIHGGYGTGSRFGYFSNFGCATFSSPKSNFVSSDSAFCAEGGECIDFFDHSTNNPTNWQWHFPGAYPDTSTQQNPTNICYYQPGTYSVSLIAGNQIGSDTLIVSPMITFESSPPSPILVLSGDTVYCNHFTSYQWYKDGTVIPNATDSFCVFTNDGTYSVFITDSLGCSRMSTGVLFSGITNIKQGQVKIYPNPATNQLLIMNNASWYNGGALTAEIYNCFGQKVQYSVLQDQSKNGEVLLDISSLPDGIYIIEVKSSERILRGRFVKQ